MKPFLAALRTLAVLVACLGVLAFAAWLLHELPPRDVRDVRRAAEAAERAQALARERTEATREARSAATNAAASATSAARATALAPDLDAGSPMPETPLTLRHRVCDGATDASISRIRLDARGRELLAIGCGDTLDVIGFVGAEPVTIAELAPAATDQAAPVRRFTITSEDVTGDGSIDWLVGTWRSLDHGSPAVGSLHLLAGDGRGGLGDAVLLAPVAVGAIDVGRVDDDAIVDIAVLHRPDSVGSRAPEAWVFRGGPSPVRVARMAMPRDTRTLALLDADLDGFADIVPAGLGTASSAIFAGDGRGGFARHLEIAAPGAEQLHRAASSALGARLLFAGAPPTWLLPATGTPTLAPLAIVGTPVASDVHADGPTGATLVWLADGVIRLVDVTERAPRGRGTVTLASEAGRVVAVVLGDFRGEAKLDLAMLVERTRGLPERDLVILADVGSASESTDAPEQTLTLAPERPGIARAPLCLAIPLR